MNLPAALGTKLPKMQPMPLVRQPEPFDDPDWIFEVKFDRFRALAYVEDGDCRRPAPGVVRQRGATLGD